MESLELPAVDVQALATLSERFGVAVGLGAFVVGLLIVTVGFRVAGWVAPKGTLRDALPLLRPPSRLVLPLLSVWIVLPAMQLGPVTLGLVRTIMQVMVIPSVAWLVFRVLLVGEALILDQYKLGEKNNLLARKMHTQVLFMRRLSGLVILLLTRISHRISSRGVGNRDRCEEHE